MKLGLHKKRLKIAHRKKKKTCERVAQKKPQAPTLHPWGGKTLLLKETDVRREWNGRAWGIGGKKRVGSMKREGSRLDWGGEKAKAPKKKKKKLGRTGPSRGNQKSVTGGSVFIPVWGPGKTTREKEKAPLWVSRSKGNTVRGELPQGGKREKAQEKSPISDWFGEEGGGL